MTKVQLRKWGLHHIDPAVSFEIKKIKLWLIYSPSAKPLTINILWQIWQGRNERDFNKKEKNWLKTIHKASSEWLAYDDVQTKGKNKSTSGCHFQVASFDVFSVGFPSP